MISKAFDYAAETIAAAFDLDEDKEKLIRLGLILTAAYFGGKFVRSIVTKRG